MRIKKNDTIQVMAGKDKGKRGTVTRTLPETKKVIVEGVNIVKKHEKSRRQGRKGERIEVPAPIHISNVMLVCPHTNKPTRISYKIDGKEKLRISQKSGKKID